MKIACLQFAPQLGKVQENIKRANEILEQHASELLAASSTGSLWIVLPEMALTGYNFQSRAAIEPYLESPEKSISTDWARQIAAKYNAHVTIGYPELASPGQAYNSTITLTPTGTIAAKVRKHFLYYTDETWALEGWNPNLLPASFNDGTREPGTGFFSGDFGEGIGRVSMGICMDVNNYRFESPWTKYEFANHVLGSETPLVVLSMAWLSHKTAEELALDPEQPDEATFIYWVERMHPLRVAAEREVKEFVVVIANRAGTEEGTCYAGTSAVMRFGMGGRVEILDICGKSEERLMLVDLAARPKFALQRSGGGEG